MREIFVRSVAPGVDATAKIDGDPGDSLPEVLKIGLATYVLEPAAAFDASKLAGVYRPARAYELRPADLVEVAR